MYMEFDLDVLIKLLAENDNKDAKKIIFTTVEEFDNIIAKGLITKAENLSIQPVLQVWEKMLDGRNKISGFIIVKGFPAYTFVITGYYAETYDRLNVFFEKEKFLSVLHDTFISNLIENIYAQTVITLDVIVQAQ